MIAAKNGRIEVVELLLTHPLIEVDEVFLLMVVLSSLELPEIMIVQRVLSVVGQIPRHRVA